MSARMTGGERFFQIRNGVNLCGPESAGGQCGEFAEPLGDGLFLLHPGEQGFRAMKGEDAPAAWVGIEAAGEKDLGAGALVTKRERSLPSGDPEWNTGDVLGEFFLNAGERGTFGLGLDGVDGFAVSE
jgi:hypothetical protein